MKQWEKLGALLARRTDKLEYTDTANRIYELEQELMALKASKQNRLEDADYSLCVKLQRRLQATDKRCQKVHDKQLVQDIINLVKSPLPKA